MTDAIVRPKRTVRQRLRSRLGLPEPLADQARLLVALEIMYEERDDEQPWLWIDPPEQHNGSNDSFGLNSLRVKGLPN